MEMRVLLVDDAAEVRLVLRTFFDYDGRFEVVGEAENGDQAVELCRDLRPDAVLLDLHMPGLCGQEALVRMREACPETTVVIFTSHADPDARDTLFAAGAAAVITKGTHPAMVVAHVAVILERPL